MSLHRANRTWDSLLSKSLWQRWWNVSPASCFVICDFIFADWGEILLLALKKEAAMLWIAHGKCHMIRNRRWPVGVESRPHWQPVRKWEPQSYSVRRWILPATLRSLDAHLSPVKPLMRLQPQLTLDCHLRGI